MTDVSSAGRAGVSAWLRSPLTWMIIAACALAGSLYYPLFFPDSIRDLTQRGEQFFFEANEAAGAPVLVLSLWLFYRRSHYRDLLRRPGAPRAATIVFAITVALYGWGVYTGAMDLQLASCIGLLAGLALLLGGRPGVRAFWLPILFLGFALPISPVLLSAVIYPVQLATAQYAGFLLNAIGVASFVQGDQILRPENTFVVIETCSGLRTIVTLTMLTVLLIDLFERRGWHAAVLIGLAPIVAFLTNGIRVVTLVLNPYSDIVSVHNLQGIAMLLVGLTGIYLIDGLVERLRDRVGSHDAPHDLPVTADGAVSNRAMTIRWAVVCGVLIVMHGIGQWVAPWPAQRYVHETSSAFLDRILEPWPSEHLAPDYNFLGSVRFLTWDDRRVRVGRNDFVDVFVAVADEQHRAQTILTPRLAWPASGYAVTQDDLRPIRSLGAVDRMNGPSEVRRLVLRRGGKWLLAYSWHERSTSLPAEWIRHAAALDRSPFARPQHILAVRLSTSLDEGVGGIDAAEERIRRVYARLAPELEDFAPVFPPEVPDLEPTSRMER